MTTAARRLFELKRRLHEAAVGAQSSAERAARATVALVHDAQGHFLRAIENLADEPRDAGELELYVARARLLSRKLDAARLAAQAASDAAEAQEAITSARRLEAEQMKRWEELEAESARSDEARRERLREDELAARRRCK